MSPIATKKEEIPKKDADEEFMIYEDCMSSDSDEFVIVGAVVAKKETVPDVPSPSPSIGGTEPENVTESMVDTGFDILAATFESDTEPETEDSGEVAKAKEVLRAKMKLDLSKKRIKSDPGPLVRRKVYLDIPKLRRRRKSALPAPSKRRTRVKKMDRICVPKRRLVVIRNIKGKYPNKLSKKVVDRLAKLGMTEREFKSVAMGASLILNNKSSSKQPFPCLGQRANQWGTAGAITGGVTLCLATVALGPAAIPLAGLGAALGGATGWVSSTTMDCYTNNDHLRMYLKNVNRRYASKHFIWKVIAPRAGDLSVGLMLEAKPHSIRI